MLFSVFEALTDFLVRKVLYFSDRLLTVHCKGCDVTMLDGSIVKSSCFGRTEADRSRPLVTQNTHSVRLHGPLNYRGGCQLMNFFLNRTLIALDKSVQNSQVYRAFSFASEGEKTSNLTLHCRCVNNSKQKSGNLQLLIITLRHLLSANEAFK